MYCPPGGPPAVGVTPSLNCAGPDRQEGVGMTEDASVSDRSGGHALCAAEMVGHAGRADGTTSPVSCDLMLRLSVSRRHASRQERHALDGHRGCGILEHTRPWRRLVCGYPCSVAGSEAERRSNSDGERCDLRRRGDLATGQCSGPAPVVAPPHWAVGVPSGEAGRGIGNGP